MPIAPVIDNFLGVSATAVLKVDTLADLVKAAKAQPGKLNWAATPGCPITSCSRCRNSAGIEMVQVAYRDFAPAYQDLNQGGCTSPAPACRPWCRITAPAPPSSCS